LIFNGVGTARVELTGFRYVGLSAAAGILTVQGSGLLFIDQVCYYFED
jgi:hypothetical protein